MPRDSASYEILEHTADVGVRAQGATLEEAFENACWGMLEVLGAVERDRGATTRTIPVALADPDPGALLVDWLNEVLFNLDVTPARVTDVRVVEVSAHGLEGEIDLADQAEPPDGTELKAATYHRLAVQADGERPTVTAYFDV